MKITDFQIIDTMRSHGGGFASALAVAAMRADHDNLARIKRAFPEYWTNYRLLAERIASKLAREDA